MPKILPKAQQLEERWLIKLAELDDTDTELFIPADDRKDQRAKERTFRDLVAKLDRDDPILASRIVISTTLRDRRHWVVLKLSEHSPLVGFTKNAEGIVERIEISIDPNRERFINLMVADGLSQDEMNEALAYPLTATELRKLEKRGKK